MGRSVLDLGTASARAVPLQARLPEGRWLQARRRMRRSSRRWGRGGDQEEQKEKEGMEMEEEKEEAGAALLDPPVRDGHG